MGYILTILGLIGFLIMGILWIEIGKMFFKIQAIEGNRKYLGYFKEYFSLPPGVVFSSEFVNFFPLSFLFKNKETNRSNAIFEIEQLYRNKIKLEIVFWSIFLLGIISIPIVEFIIKPYLL